LKPNQLQQQAIYDDEQARARRAAMAKMGFAVVRQMPTTAHGGFRPVTPLGKPIAVARPKVAARSSSKINGSKLGGKAGVLKSRVPVAARTRVAASTRVVTAARVATPTRIVLPVRPVAQVRITAPAKPVARPRPKPAAPRAHAPHTKKKGTSRH
jgi:hypothetical protein